ncbi:MAG: zinc ABC transporter substrate-binding protein, partial [Candidatus Thiodiazotropha sp. (ex Notomyrtea botanica)]|nr:zinc ABC transporter substrate-binding protein [Candidatus Thiodiazotropha sp. (ex Notomyrtea botanica)]
MHLVVHQCFGQSPLRLILVVILLNLSSSALATPRVVVSLKPIHSLVAGLMQGVAEPKLLLDDNQSPHNLSLKPSQIRMLSQADLIIWIGATLEPALSHLLQPNRYKAEVLSLLETPELLLLPVRDRKVWHSHGHASHQHEQPPESTGSTDQMDNHIWLSPENAARMVRHLTQRLIKLDGSNRSRYIARVGWT